MQHTKYFIEGQEAAHNGSIRVCRYNSDVNQGEWLAGYDSVSRNYAVFKILPSPGPVTIADLDPAYVGNLSQCEAKAVTLKNKDRQGNYVVYNLIEGKPYVYKGLDEK